jgi:ubiquitin thioesterase protein OTUB1
MASENNNNNSNNNNAATAAELDRQTLARLDEIEQQVKQQPLTSELKPLSTLLDLYCQQLPQGEDDAGAVSSSSSPSHFFLAGVQALMSSGGYSHIRLVRGDGNCYYRAFLYALAEKIMQTNDNNEDNDKSDNNNNNKKKEEEEGRRIVEWIKKDSWQKVLQAGYEEISMEAFYETIVELMEKILVSSTSGSSSSSSSSSSNRVDNAATPAATPAAAATVASTSTFNLHDEMNQENGTSDYCTWYLRVVTAMHLKSDPDRFLPFLPLDHANNVSDMQQFCQREVEPMVRTYVRTSYRIV